MCSELCGTCTATLWQSCYIHAHVKTRNWDTDMCPGETPAGRRLLQVVRKQPEEAGEEPARAWGCGMSECPERRSDWESDRRCIAGEKKARSLINCRSWWSLGCVLSQRKVLKQEAACYDLYFKRIILTLKGECSLWTAPAGWSCFCIQRA